MAKRIGRLRRAWRWLRKRPLRYLRLAWRLVVLYRLRRRPEYQAQHRGLTIFERHYAPDGIVAYTAEESAILSLMAGCLNCGLCLARCPALRVLTTDRRGRRYAGPRDVAISLSRSAPDFWATVDTLYFCTMCGACEALCPVGIPIPEVVAMMRRIVLRQAAAIPQQVEVPRSHTALQENLRTVGNIYGQPLEPWPYRKPRAEYVFFAGCVYSYLERESLLRTLRLLERLGVDFTTIEERCCGGPSRVVGGEVVREVAEHNLSRIAAAGTNKVIVACPRCYLTLSSSEPYAGKLEVIYTTQLLMHHLDALTVHRPADQETRDASSALRLTYHDPCELGRLRGEYSSARRVLRWLEEQGDMSFVEMPHHGAMSDCCGAGGGVRGAYAPLSVRMARRRFEEAQGIGADVLLTECPSCLHNFRNARRSRDTMRVYNLSEWVEVVTRGIVSG